MAVYFEELKDYEGLGRALKIYNEHIELAALLEKGPRIIHLSVPGGKNIFGIAPEMAEKLPNGKTWNIMGGHRVWHSPEAYPRSYMSDNEPLARYEVLIDGIRLIQAEEEWTHIQKIIEVHLKDDRVLVKNTLRNRGAWPVEMAVWSLTVGSRNGREVLPVTQRNTGLLPNTFYVSWPYSRLNDPRVKWGQRYIIVENDPADKTAFKFGYPNELGWMAYFNHEQCFIKKNAFKKGEQYPDLGCSWETYTSYWGVELECLDPLYTVKPGKEITMHEEWFIFGDMAKPDADEDAVAAALAGIADKAEIELPVVSDVVWDPNFEEEE